MIDLSIYDHFIVAFSGGKDSVACFLTLLELGISVEKIELWHHKIDGAEGSTLMDWPVTDDYCLKFASAFGVPIYYSWKVGGFEGEMLRENKLTNPNKFEYLNDDNIIECGLSGGIRGKESTRLKFPQVTANLSQRWCSAYLKIDVCTAAINNQKRFIGKRTLVITGERAEESSARAKYKEFEPDRSTSKSRHVDHWRPVHSWAEKAVWEIMEKYKVNPHISYRLGWNRLSCMFYIFGSDNQWASAHVVDPNRLKVVVEYEDTFDVSIHRKKYLPERIQTGIPYSGTANYDLVQMAKSPIFAEDLIIDNWVLPAGAYEENVGPN